MTKKTLTRTTQGLRDILFDEIDAIRGEEGDPKRANAVAHLSRQIISTARLEMDFKAQISRLQNQGADANLGGLALGSV